MESSIEETVMVLKWLVEEYKKYPPEILFLYCKELNYWKIKCSLDMKFSWKLSFPKAIPLEPKNTGQCCVEA